MSKTITLRDANQGFSRCIREVESGEEFIITRNGIPVARLSPIGGKRVLTPEQEAALERTRERMAIVRHLNIERFDRDEVYEDRIERLVKRTT
jgi:prevent-host-death family protein